MLTLVLNSGSSSVKFALLDPHSSELRLSGLIERLGSDAACATLKKEEEKRVVSLPEGTYAAAFKVISDELDFLNVRADVRAIGHRVVHAGEKFSGSVRLTDEVMAALRECIPLAPLHNPPNIAGIEAAQQVFPNLPQVGVFDTAFHQTLPPAAYTYALDAATADEHRIRRYGFHGTSHKYVSEAAASFLGRDLAQLRQIVLHLGNGASMTAVDGGRSVETSMGFTPLEGLVMGTRTGDIDPAALFHLSRRAGLSTDELDELLNKRSGLLGLAGRSDMRDILAGRAAGEEQATLAYDVYVHRLRAYLGAYVAQLGGVDVIVFTAGVGENAVDVRADALATFGFLGVKVDAERNGSRGRGIRRISSDDSAVEVLVVPTDEELEIARQTLSAI